MSEPIESSVSCISHVILYTIPWYTMYVCDARPSVIGFDIVGTGPWRGAEYGSRGAAGRKADIEGITGII